MARRKGYYRSQDIGAGYIEFTDIGFGIRALIGVRIASDNTLLFELALGPERTIGDDCRFALDVDGATSFHRQVQTALSKSTAMDGDLGHVGDVKYLTSDRDDHIPKPVGSVAVEAAQSRVRLVVSFDPRTGDKDFIMVMDTASAGHLSAMLDRILSKKTRN